MNGLISIFAAFFKVGLFSFGGGMAMLPIIYQSVQQFGFMSTEEFSNLVALSQVTPGPVAVNAATYVGLFFGGMPAALVATLGICLPCFLIMLIVSKLLERFKENRYVQGAMTGIRPVTIGLIGAATLFLAEGVLVKGPVVSAQLWSGLDYYNLIPLGIFGASIVLMSVCKVKPIWVMLIMAVVGAVIYGWIL